MHCNVEGFKTRGEWSYALRAQGNTWIRVAEILNANSPEAAHVVARQYARSRGKPWPAWKRPAPPPKPQREPQTFPMQEQAYRLRASGLPWKEVRALVGYKHIPNAIAAARQFAERTGQAWPLPSA